MRGIAENSKANNGPSSEQSLSPTVKGSEERDDKGEKKRKEAGRGEQEILREGLANKYRKFSRPERGELMKGGRALR